jgi:hypothetical protein
MEKKTKNIFIATAILSVMAVSIAFASYIYPLSANTSYYEDNEVDKAIKIARDFLVQAPTFRYDGILDTLTLSDVQILESYPVQYIITITFNSRNAGYGDRAGLDLAQIITPHTAIIKVVNGEMVSAILDNQWDERVQNYVEIHYDDNPDGTVVIHNDE